MNKKILLIFGMLGFFITLPQMVQAAPAEASASKTVAAEQSSEAVIQKFSSDIEVSPERKIATKRKHQILFIMGITLLVLLLLTGSFGIAMVAFDKNVFVPHMIFAGLSLTLAVAHAATSIAWFWPY